MKIVQINIFFDEGSTGKIVGDIHSRLLRDGHQSYVVFGRGKHQVDDDPIHLYRTTSDKVSQIYRKISRVTGLRYNIAYIETYQLINRIERINPDIVHLHCLNCAYINPFILLKYLGKKGYPVLVTHHADVTITANCDHAFDCNRWKTGCGKCKTNQIERRSFWFDGTHLSWIQMKKAFGYVKHLYASGVSDWMSDRVRQSPFFTNSECRTIFNGLDIDAFHYRGKCENLKKQLELKETDSVILHVTPDFSAPNKGGEYITVLAKRLPDIKFVVVGIKASNLKGLPSNVIPISHIDSKEKLSEFYSMANLTLLTSYRESFSMVTAESLCCGTQVAGFMAGAPETIAIPEYSTFVEYGNIDLLQTKVMQYLMKPVSKTTISEVACKVYDAEEMYCKYRKYYCSILNG